MHYCLIAYILLLSRLTLLPPGRLGRDGWKVNEIRKSQNRVTKNVHEVHNMCTQAWWKIKRDPLLSLSTWTRLRFSPYPLPPPPPLPSPPLPFALKHRNLPMPPSPSSFPLKAPGHLLPHPSLTLAPPPPSPFRFPVSSELVRKKDDTPYCLHLWLESARRRPEVMKTSITMNDVTTKSPNPGLEMANDTVANTTKMVRLATKSFQAVAKLARLVQK